MPPSVAACSLIAATIRGWQLPALWTESPLNRSTYARPSASQSVAPSPRTNSTGARGYVGIA